jgi:hypothetical protein
MTLLYCILSAMGGACFGIFVFALLKANSYEGNREEALLYENEDLERRNEELREGVTIQRSIIKQLESELQFNRDEIKLSIIKEMEGNNGI